MSSSPADSRWQIGEPPPAATLARQPYYEWLIVGVTCIGAFIGQLDASIVQRSDRDLEPSDAILA